MKPISQMKKKGHVMATIPSLSNSQDGDTHPRSVSGAFNHSHYNSLDEWLGYNHRL